MRALIWIIRLLLFFLLFAFAVKNYQPVRLHFFLESEWNMPLVFIILVAFSAGALMGVTATFASLLRQRREIGRLRRDLAKTREHNAEVADPTALRTR